MRRRRLYVFSPVDICGRPFGGSLDVVERLKWSVGSYDRVIVFCPGVRSSVERRSILGGRIIVVYSHKRLSVTLAVLASAAMAWKPVFRVRDRRLLDRDATYLFEGLLSIFMLPQVFMRREIGLRLKIRVHNDEALFHFDRAATESGWILRCALRFEAARLWAIERTFYTFAAFDRCFISNAEASRFGRRPRDTVVPYSPSSVERLEAASVDSGVQSIVTVANFGLADNRRAICDFLDKYLSGLCARGFRVVIGGYGSELLRHQYANHPGVCIHGAVGTDQESELYRHALCYLVASNNRAGFKTRISTALANGLIPVLHGRGAEANAEDALVSVTSSRLMQVIDENKLIELSQALIEGRYDRYSAAVRADYEQFLLR